MMVDDLIGIPFAYFTSTVLGKTFHVSPGAPGRFSHLLDWAELNRILNEDPLDAGRLKLTRDGTFIDARTYLEYPAASSSRGARLLTDALTTELRAGGTLIIDGIEDLREPIGDLAAAFETRFRDPVGVNAYASWEPVKGFDLHWDEHDVFVFQVAGQKRWKLYGSTKQFPLTRREEVVPKPTTEPQWDELLTDGDILYIPRGCWHVAVAEDGPSLHLSLGIRRRTGVDYLGWLTRLLRESESFRMDIPRFGGEQSVRDYVANIHDALISAVSEETIQAFLREQDEFAPRRPAMNLPWSLEVPADVARRLPPETSVSLAAPRIAITARDDHVLLAVDGREWTFHPSAKPLFERLSRGRCTVAELADDPGHDLSQLHVNALVALAAAEGLIVLRTP